MYDVVMTLGPPFALIILFAATVVGIFLVIASLCGSDPLPRPCVVVGILMACASAAALVSTLESNFYLNGFIRYEQRDNEDGTRTWHRVDVPSTTQPVER